MLEEIEHRRSSASEVEFCYLMSSAKMSLKQDEQVLDAGGASCHADAALEQAPQSNSATSTPCHSAPPSCHSATPSCHTPAASTRLDGLILLFGALAAAFGWVIWLLPDSSPLNQEWLLSALSTIVVWGVGWPILRDGWTSTLARSPNMNTLISLGVLVAWIWSMSVTTTDTSGDIHFTMASTIIVFVRLGGWLESRAQARSQDAVASLAKLSVTTARLEDGADIPIEDLAVGMRFVVRPGERIAADGVVVSGHSAIDKSFLTGEPIPEAVQPGDEVTGATLNTTGLLTVEARRVGTETAHAQIMRLLEEAEQSRAPVQRLVDRASAVFVPAVIAAAAIAFIGWMLAGESAATGIAAGVAVLVVACPCALGLATPTAIVAGVGRAAREGIIIRSGNVWEAARHLDTAVIDKTGTLTHGRPSVREIVIDDLTDGLLRGENLLREGELARERDPEQTRDTQQEGDTEQTQDDQREDDTEQEANPTQEKVLEIASALAQQSLHPLSQAIARERESSIEFRDLKETPGAGILAEFKDGGKAALGSRSLFSEIPDRLTEAASSAAAKGFASVFVGWGSVDAMVSIAETSPVTHISSAAQNPPVSSAVGGEVGAEQIPSSAQLPQAKGLIICADELREDANQSVADMQSLGISVIMATGDSEASAHHVAEQVKPDRVIAECLPQDKLAEVNRLQKTGSTVAMIGDGVNDAAALAKADVGIALSDGADVAAEASDITVIGGDFRKSVKAIQIARKTSSTILANLVWACIYNTALLPLAAAGVMPPVAAAGAMSLSSLCVVGNSLRLARRQIN